MIQLAPRHIPGHSWTDLLTAVAAIVIAAMILGISPSLAVIAFALIGLIVDRLAPELLDALLGMRPSSWPPSERTSTLD